MFVGKQGGNPLHKLIVFFKGVVETSFIPIFVITSADVYTNNNIGFFLEFANDVCSYVYNGFLRCENLL